MTRLSAIREDDMARIVQEITADNFESVVARSSLPMLVDFWAPWCGPCRTMGPIVDELAAELAESLRVGRLNVDEEREVAARHEVFSIPTMLLFVDGAVRKRIIGALPKRRLLDELSDHLPA